jgi:hypothetical protein
MIRKYAKVLLLALLMFSIPVSINFLAEQSFAQQQAEEYSCPYASGGQVEQKRFLPEVRHDAEAKID